MSSAQTATVQTSIAATPHEVWQALISPDAIKQYMFGTTVDSDWQQGCPITWSGEFKGKAYQDKGTLLTVEPEKVLKYTHYSPLSGQPDVPEHYHTVTIQLAPDGSMTTVRLSQDKNADDKAAAEAAKNWQAMLDGLKQYVEGVAASDQSVD